MTDFVAAIDDSGSSEVGVTWAGEPIVGDSAYCGLSCVVVRSSSLAEFEGRWNHLRTQIGRTLGVGTPPLHMSWMWGKNPPAMEGKNQIGRAHV